MKSPALPALCVSTLCIFAVATALAAPNDFDGDGTSDPAAVTEEDPLDWRARWGGTVHNVASSFGYMGVHLMPAHYSGSAATEPGYVEPSGTWHIISGGIEHTFTHGADGATYIGGADVDGDSRDDALYHDNRCSRKLVTVRALLNPLAAEPASLSFTAGQGRFVTTYGDANGDGADDFCWLEGQRQGQKFTGRFTMICKDVQTGMRRAEFNAGKLYLRPLPLATGAGSADYFAFVRVRADHTVVQVRDIHGALVRKVRLDGTGPLLIGNYTNSTGEMEQLAIANDSALTVYDIAGDAPASMPAPSGMKFDEFNMVYFNSDLAKCICTTDRMDKRGRCRTSAAAVHCAARRSVHDGDGGFFHKPISDQTGEIVDIFPAGENIESCRYEYEDGGAFREAYDWGLTSPDRPTWRPVGQGRCERFPQPTVVACTVNGRENCWVLPDACQTYD